MTLATEAPATQQLGLPEELLLMLLNEESGYFHQVAGWDLNCAVIGAVLAELSFMSRIDTDVESLILLDKTATGNPILDPSLKAIADEPVQRNTQYWIERLAPHAELIIDLTLDRLVELKILKHHEGEFWTIAHNAWQSEAIGGPEDGTAAEFVKTRISKVIFNNELPEPRDVIIIALINTCDVLRFMFPLDEESEERIELICRLDLIGRSIVDAVASNLAGPALQHASLSKPIPRVSLLKLVRNPHARGGNLPALFADLAKEYGPVFEVKFPLRERMIVLAGPRTNQWVHRHGRMYLRSKDYFENLERVYGSSRTIHSLDGADHFRFRKAMQSSYSRASVMRRLDDVLDNARTHMATWAVGDTISAGTMLRLYMNAQISPLLISADTQDLIEDIIKYKERALNIHVAGTLPKFLLHTPAMRRRAEMIEELAASVQSSHTPAQRTGCPRDLADDFLSLHASDPQFLPESDLHFPLATMLLASMYLGDQLGFALYAMVSHPELHERVRAEADALFANGDPSEADLTPDSFDVTRRLLMETLRMTPIAAMSMRNVMNTCVVEGYELPVGSRVYYAQAASHYMEDVFPEPFKFDIDRYLAPRDEHVGLGYAPFGLGTHTCLGRRWAELQLSLNLLMLAHYFRLELPPDQRLPISSFPSMSPTKKLRFLVAEQRHELPI